MSDFLPLPSSAPPTQKFVSLDAAKTVPTATQNISNPYNVTPLNKIDGIGRYLNSSSWKTIGYSMNNPDIEQMYYDKTPMLEQWGNAGIQFLGQTKAAFGAQLNKLEQIKETFGKPTPGYLDDNFQASEELLTKYPVFKSNKEVAGPLGYIPFVGDSASKWSNFMPNLGFTGGTMAGVFLENLVATAIIEGVTGGGGTPLAMAKWVKSGYEMVRDIKNFANIGKVTANATKAFGSAGNILRGAEAIAAGKSANGALHSIYGGYQLYSASAGEALIENAHSVGELVKEFKTDFETKNNRPPTGDEIKVMQASAEGLVLPSTLGNIGVLMASNFLQEMNAFKAGKALSSLSIAGSKVLGTEVSKRMILDETTGLFRTATANEINKITAKSIGKHLFNVFSEGLEESAQGVIAESTKEFFKAQYYDKPISWTDALGAGFAYAGSPQGKEEFWAGVITGGIFTGGGRAANKYQLRKDSKKFFKETGQNINDIANAQSGVLNEIIPLIKFNVSSSRSTDNLKYQSVIEQKIKEATDNYSADLYKASALAKAMFTAKHYGKDEVLLEHYKALSRLNPDDLSRYLGIPMEDLSSPAEMQRAFMRMEEISKSVDVVSERFANPFKLPNIAESKYANEADPEKGKEMYIADLSKFEAWQSAQELLVTQSFLAKEADKHFGIVQANLNSTNVPLDLLAAVMTQSDVKARSMDKYLTYTNEYKDLKDDIRKAKALNKRKEVRFLKKRADQLNQKIKDIRPLAYSEPKGPKHALANYLEELDNRINEGIISLSLIPNNTKEAQTKKDELNYYQKEYSILTNRNLTREEKLEELSDARLDGQEFKFNLKQVLADGQGIDSIQELIKAFDLLGRIKQDINFSENVLDLLNTKEKMSVQATLMSGRIYQSRANLFSNIEQDVTDEGGQPSPIAFTDVSVVEETPEVISEAAPTEESTSEEKPATPQKKFEIGATVIYEGNPFTIVDIDIENEDGVLYMIQYDEDTEPFGVLRSELSFPEEELKPTEKATLNYPELRDNLDALSDKYKAEGKSQEEADALALSSLTEEERNFLREEYQKEIENPNIPNPEKDLEAKEELTPEESKEEEIEESELDEKEKDADLPNTIEEAIAEEGIPEVAPLISFEERIKYLVAQRVMDILMGDESHFGVDEEFYQDNKSRIDSEALEDIQANKKLEDKVEEEVKEEIKKEADTALSRFIIAFNNLLPGDSALPEGDNAIYKLLSKIKYSIAPAWFKFKDKELSIDLKNTFEEKSKNYGNVYYKNVSNIKNQYTNRVMNVNVKESYDNFDLFKHQHALHLDITENNVEQVVDKLLRFVNENEVYMLVSSSYNIARPDNLRIYSKDAKIPLEKMDELISDLALIIEDDVENPIMRDFEYEKLPSNEEVVDFINALDPDVKENVLNYLRIYDKDREFLTNPEKSYKNGLSVASLDAVTLFNNAFEKFKETGKFSHTIIEPIVNNQLKKVAFYGEAKDIYEELMNNEIFKSSRNTKYFKNLIDKAKDKKKELSTFNFTNKDLSINMMIYQSATGDSFRIINHTLLTKDVKLFRVIEVEDVSTKKVMVVTPLEFRNKFSEVPPRLESDPAFEEEEKKKKIEEEDFNKYPNTLFTTISNDDDLFYNIDSEEGTPDNNRATGKLAIQRLANREITSNSDLFVRVETPNYTDTNSVFYIPETGYNPNVPKDIQKLFRSGELTEFGKVVTLIEDTGEYSKFDKNGKKSDKGVIPMFFLPKGKLIITDDTISYGGRVLQPISTMMEKENMTREEVIERATEEAAKLDKLHAAKNYQNFKLDGVSNGVTDGKSKLTYEDIKPLLDSAVFEMDRTKVTGGGLTLHINDTSVKLEKKPIGGDMALAILAYLGMDPEYFSRKGYSIGPGIKYALATLKKEMEHPIEQEDAFDDYGDPITTKVNYGAKVSHLRFLDKVLYMGTTSKDVDKEIHKQNIEIVSNQIHGLKDNPELFEMIIFKNYAEDEGSPTIFFLNDTWKRLKKNESISTADHFAYIDTLLDFLSKISFDTHPDFVESSDTTNFVVRMDENNNPILDIAKVDIPEYLMDKYNVHGIVVNESLLDTKNRYLKIDRLVSEETTKKPAKKEKSIEEMISERNLERDEEDFIEFNVKPLNSNKKSGSKTATNDFKLKSLGKLPSGLTAEEFAKARKEIMESKTEAQINKIINDITNC